jgi:hypothetical protein
MTRRAAVPRAWHYGATSRRALELAQAGVAEGRWQTALPQRAAKKGGVHEAGGPTSGLDRRRGGGLAAGIRDPCLAKAGAGWHGAGHGWRSGGQNPACGPTRACFNPV